MGQTLGATGCVHQASNGDAQTRGRPPGPENIRVLETGGWRIYSKVVLAPRDTGDAEANRLIVLVAPW